MLTEQVRFRCCIEKDEEYGGILVDNKYVICGCCGGVFELDDGEVEILEKLRWVPISEEILGEG